MNWSWPCTFTFSLFLSGSGSLALLLASQSNSFHMTFHCISVDFSSLLLSSLPVKRRETVTWAGTGKRHPFVQVNAVSFTSPWGRFTRTYDWLHSKWKSEREQQRQASNVLRVINLSWKNSNSIANIFSLLQDLFSLLHWLTLHCEHSTYANYFTFLPHLLLFLCVCTCYTGRLAFLSLNSFIHSFILMDHCYGSANRTFVSSNRSFEFNSTQSKL